MAELQRTVLAGGVIYAAGTQEDDELRAIIDARHWSDYSPSARPGDGSPSDADLDSLRQLAAREIAERDTRVDELTAAAEESAAQVVEVTRKLDESAAEVERLTEENADLRQQLEAGAKSPGAADVDPYKGLKATQLSAEIAKRNADRDPDGDAYIRPASADERADLLAALQADDARTAGA